MAHCFSDLELRDGSKFEEMNISNWASVRILSHLKVSGLKKSAILEFWQVIEILSQFEVEPSQNLMHMPPRDNTSFDDFLSHFKDSEAQGMTHTVWGSYRLSQMLFLDKLSYYTNLYWNCHQDKFYVSGQQHHILIFNDVGCHQHAEKCNQRTFSSLTSRKWSPASVSPF